MKHLFFVLFVLVIYSCSKEEQTETIDKEEIGQEIAKLVYFEKFTEAELVNYLEEKNIEFSREIADISSGYLKVFSKEKIEEITLSFKSRKTELETRNTPCFDDWVEDMEDAYDDGLFCYGLTFAGSVISGPGFAVGIVSGSVGCFIQHAIDITKAENRYEDCMKKKYK